MSTIEHSTHELKNVEKQTAIVLHLLKTHIFLKFIHLIRSAVREYISLLSLHFVDSMYNIYCILVLGLVTM